MSFTGLENDRRPLDPPGSVRRAGFGIRFSCSITGRQNPWGVAVMTGTVRCTTIGPLSSPSSPGDVRRDLEPRGPGLLLVVEPGEAGEPRVDVHDAPCKDETKPVEQAPVACQAPSRLRPAEASRTSLPGPPAAAPGGDGLAKAPITALSSPLRPRCC